MDLSFRDELIDEAHRVEILFNPGDCVRSNSFALAYRRSGGDAAVQRGGGDTITYGIGFQPH